MTHFSTKSNIEGLISSAVIDIEHIQYGAIYFIKGVEVSWDWSNISTGDYFNEPEYNDEIRFSYSDITLEVTSDKTGIEVEAGSYNYLLCMQLLGDIKQFEGGIIEFIKSNL